jgi:S-methylmethionine-dependent homocysteine/selenocysteine methylase
MSVFSAMHAARGTEALLVIDGAMGTELEARGMPMDGDAWCALANLEQPALVRAIHEDHIRAGADVIITNTYMSGPGPMARAGVADRFTEGIDNAVSAARQAIEAAADHPVAVAGSVATTPWGAPEARDEAGLRDGYARQMDRLATDGVDLIALEMVVDERHGRPALEAALATGLPVWLGLSTCTPGRTDGDYEALPEIDEARDVARALLTPELAAVTVMHTDIDDVSPALEMLAPLWDGVVGVYPHHGRWLKPHWHFEDVDPAHLVDLAGAWVAAGATMLGGCCGLRTRHVAALRAAVDAGTLAGR